MKESRAPDTNEGHAQKVSVSMPSGRIAAVKERVGARGFSAYVSAAVERQLQRDLLEELLVESEAQTGPIPQEMADRATRAFRMAEALVEREQSTSAGAEGGNVSEEGDAWHGRKAG
jgi:hypothetical protein